MTRTAISPRFAIRTFLKGFMNRLERDVAVLLGGVLVALGGGHLQAGDDLAPRVAGQDDLVDEAAVGGHVGVGELLAELGHALRARGGGIGRLGQLAGVEDVYRAFRDDYAVSIEEIDGSTREFHIREIPKREVRTVAARVRKIAEKCRDLAIKVDEVNAPDNG